ncbi:MAG: DUF2243 domain-containing protein [Chloroflexota bacterium]|nr:DUF2243 domain-containing protein [Chloroflexota bacterium]
MGRNGNRGDGLFIGAGLLLGIGLGGLFDGIVLHQILQWHHMVSHVDRYDPATVSGLEANTLADGLFHAVTYVFLVAGLWCLWRYAERPAAGWSTTAFIGLLLMGFGTFNLVEGVINHLVLEVHHVRDKSERQLAWDLGFLAWGLAMLGGGWALARRSDRTAS